MNDRLTTDCPMKIFLPTIKRPNDQTTNNQVTWLWPGRRSERIPVSKVAVVDRMMIPSDPVSKVSDRLSSLGMVIATRRTVDLKVLAPAPVPPTIAAGSGREGGEGGGGGGGGGGRSNNGSSSNDNNSGSGINSNHATGTYLEVPAEALEVVGAFLMGDWVVHNRTQWVGQVDAAQYVITVQLDQSPAEGAGSGGGGGDGGKKGGARGKKGGNGGEGKEGEVR